MFVTMWKTRKRRVSCPRRRPHRLPAARAGSSAVIGKLCLLNCGTVVPSGGANWNGGQCLFLPARSMTPRLMVAFLCVLISR